MTPAADMTSPTLSPGAEASFLTPSNGNDDRSIHSEQDTDSEDDSVLGAARTSSDIREHDRKVLLDEDELDQMLTENRLGRRGSGLSLPNPFKKMMGKTYGKGSAESGPSSESLSNNAGSEEKERRRQRRARRKDKKDRLVEAAAHGEDRGLMYEMEEGFLKEGSVTGESSNTEDLSDIDKHEHSGNDTSKRRKYGRMCYISVLILLAFALLALGAWKLSMGRRKIPVQTMFNNGTALFAPTTILISLDGFRADFLQRGITPRLNSFIAEGISPVYMLPSFPSVTFPNHYTLATGLYPESHGIVGNTFWDPALKREFYYTDPSRSMQPEWWGGEPIWVTAEKQGIRTAIHMWPGSEAHILDLEPSFLDTFKSKEPLLGKVDRVLELLDKPGQEDESALIADMRPQLIAAYVPNVDSAGHKYGPNSTEMRATISSVDKMLDQLFIGLEDRNLTEVVNVVIVSDHGMATTSTDRLIQLDDLIDLNLIEHTDGWPLYGLRPKSADDLMPLYDTLTAAAKAHGNFDVYLRDTNMPERYHFSKNERIAPLWIVPNTGWAIVTKEEFNVATAKAEGTEYHPKGLHGYDHENPLMRAIFIARGPAFPHSPNSRVDPFRKFLHPYLSLPLTRVENIEVYNIVCDSLNLIPQPNNGTLRLPLKPVGTHSPETTPEEPMDPLPSAASSTSVPTSTVDPSIDRPVVSDVPGVDRPVISQGPTETPTTSNVPGAPETTGEPEAGGGFWDALDGDYLAGKLEEFRNWLGGFLGGSNTAGQKEVDK
jgi:predicted AlkP superfamily pyrophosphatase or phosphodiesterase